MTERGVRHRTTREPGGTALGEEIREVLLGHRHVSLAPETELFLRLAARAVFVREEVEPALERGEVVLADRYDLSTLAYQGFGRGLELDAVRHANRLATGGLRPDLYLVLELDAAEGRARQRLEGKPEDRIEAAGSEFLTRVAAGYGALVSAGEDGAILGIDASGEPGEVEERIRRALRERFPETFADR